MTKLEVVHEPVWPTEPFALAIVTERMDALAGRLGLPVWEWEEDGLGNVRGVVVQLPGGRIVGLREYDHGVKYLMVPGPEVGVDATEVAAHGVDVVLSEVLYALGIDQGAVHWKQAATQADAAERARAVIEWRASHPPKREPDGR